MHMKTLTKKNNRIIYDLKSYEGLYEYQKSKNKKNFAPEIINYERLFTLTSVPFQYLTKH